MMNRLSIEPLTVEAREAATDLIEAGLREYFPDYDSSFNPDLRDLYRTYMTDGNYFLIGRLNGRLAATGGLLCRENDVQIVRVSVSISYRRQGMARQMMAALEEEAKKRGYTAVHLETNSDWQRAVAFYTALGYTITEQHDGNTYFCKAL